MSDPVTTHADIPGLAFDVMRQILLDRATSFDLLVPEDSDKRVCVQSMLGSFAISPRPTGGLRLEVSGRDGPSMLVMRDTLVAQLSRKTPQIVDTLRWSDAPREGARPANFQFATVLSCLEITGGFYRVVLQLEHWDAFSDKSIHFRFALPASGDVDPQWPYMTQTGKIIWPTGDKALHRPVYTARVLDAELGQITTDIFIHEGGRVTDWARKAAEGDRVAIVGPGGSGIVRRDKIILCGDETAYPAMARILESLPAEARGKAIFKTNSGAQDYSFSAPEGITVEWTGPEDPQGLASRAIAAMQSDGDHFLWFAAEKSDVQEMRAWASSEGLEKHNTHIAAYWSAP